MHLLYACKVLWDLKEGISELQYLNYCLNGCVVSFAGSIKSNYM